MEDPFYGVCGRWVSGAPIFLSQVDPQGFRAQPGMEVPEDSLCCTIAVVGVLACLVSMVEIPVGMETISVRLGTNRGQRVKPSCPLGRAKHIGDAETFFRETCNYARLLLILSSFSGFDVQKRMQSRCSMEPQDATGCNCKDQLPVSTSW
jgi:hypothetical protein